MPVTTRSMGKANNNNNNATTAATTAAATSKKYVGVKKSESTTMGKKRRSSIASAPSSAASSRATSPSGGAAGSSSSPSAASAAAADNNHQQQHTPGSLSGSFASFVTSASPVIIVTPGEGSSFSPSVAPPPQQQHTPPRGTTTTHDDEIQQSPVPNIPNNSAVNNLRGVVSSAAEASSQSPQHGTSTTTAAAGSRHHPHHFNPSQAESASPARGFGAGGIASQPFKIDSSEADRDGGGNTPPPRNAHEALLAADRYALCSGAALLETLVGNNNKTCPPHPPLPMGVSINHSSSGNKTGKINKNVNRVINPMSEVEVGRGTTEDPFRMVTFAEKQLLRLRNRILKIGSSNNNNKKTANKKSEEEAEEVNKKKNKEEESSNVFPLPPDADTNLTGCAHCTDVSHCDCVFLGELMEQVYDGLSTKRIIERGSATTTPVHTPSNSNTGTPRRHHGAEADCSNNNNSIINNNGDASISSVSISNVTAPIHVEDSNTTSNTTSRAVAAAPGRSGRHFCAKSLLTPFVARLARLQEVSPADVYYDLGCGHGSILFQIAYCTGAPCVGVELCPHNAQLAREAWDVLKPILEARSGRKMPPVYIITGDICNVIDDPQFISSMTAMAAAPSSSPTTSPDASSVAPPLLPTPKRKILLSNLLFPKMLTQYISQSCRRISPIGSSIVCFDDLYPHGRSLCQKRDPEAFDLFDMKDYVWPSDSVEWCRAEGTFYIHTRK